MPRLSTPVGLHIDDIGRDLTFALGGMIALGIGGAALLLFGRPQATPDP